MAEVDSQVPEVGIGEPLFNREDYSLEKLLNPKRTALLVVDPQNDFCHPEGFFGKGKANGPGDVSQMADAIRQTKSLIDSAHKNGVQVIFTQGFEDVAMRGEAGRRRAIKWHEIDDEGRELVSEINSKKGTFGADFFEVEPDPEKGDILIEKYDWSGFTGHDKDGNTLDEILKMKGLRTIVLTGVVAETCIETTARDAHTRDYLVFIPPGCVGSNHPEQLAARMQYWTDGYIAETEDKSEIERIWDTAA